VAVTTQIRSDGPHSNSDARFPNVPYYLLKKIVGLVYAARVRRDDRTYQVSLEWVKKPGGEVQSMPYPKTDEEVVAVLAAMKLTC
jgi:hypothetical protein